MSFDALLLGGPRCGETVRGIAAASGVAPVPELTVPVMLQPPTPHGAGAEPPASLLTTAEYVRARRKEGSVWIYVYKPHANRLVNLIGRK